MLAWLTGSRGRDCEEPQLLPSVSEPSGDSAGSSRILPGSAARNRESQPRLHLSTEAARVTGSMPPTPCAYAEAIVDFVAALGEFVGTTMFIFLSVGITNNVLTGSVALLPSTSVTGEVDDGSSTLNTSNLLYIAFGFGVSLGVCVWCFLRVCGGLFNPAVTFAFMLMRGVGVFRGIILTLAQFAGGLGGAALADALQPGKLLAAATISDNTTIVRAFFIEFFMTAMLVFTILMTAVEKNRATPLAPIAIGMVLFSIEQFAVPFTGGSVNPARALGAAVLSDTWSRKRSEWVYFIAPYCGAILATLFWGLLKFLKYEENLGRDCDDDGFSWNHNNDIRQRLQRIETILVQSEGDNNIGESVRL